MSEISNLKIGRLSGLMTVFEVVLAVVPWSLLEEIILVSGTPLLFWLCQGLNFPEMIPVFSLTHLLFDKKLMGDVPFR